jgi:hypothetical protein
MRGLSAQCEVKETRVVHRKQRTALERNVLLAHHIEADA